MSCRKLVLSFRDGKRLALNQRTLEAGAVIEVDLDFSQVEPEYTEAAWTAVDTAEPLGQTVMTIRNLQQSTAIKKRKLDQADVDRVKSMVTTPGGRLVTATASEPQGERRATLTATQRRNKNRRISKMLKKLAEDKEEEEKDALPAATASLPRPTLPSTVVRVEPTPEPTPEPTASVSSPRPTLLSTVARVEPVPETTQEPMLVVGQCAGVEPYIPQHVVLPRHLQMVSEHELEMIQRMKKRDFEYFQRVQGRNVNILEGLELYTDVFSPYEQTDIVEHVFLLRDQGRTGRLRPKTYSEPQKWKRGKGRITIQFGCCYNFAEDRRGNLPGILRYDEVDPMTSVLKRMIERMVSWRVLPANCIPNSCIINIYEEGDCIPPHIDHHDFVRPFCTVSFINRCNIMFGRELRIAGPGKFEGPVEIPLPVGSVLVLQGNGADIAKHCIPGVPYQRISITFRRMDMSRAPIFFRPDPELECLRPYEL